MSRLLVTRLRGRICTALVSEREVLQLTLEEPQEESLLHNVYVGRVQKVVPGISAAFVEFERGKTGFYSLTENPVHRFCDPAR